MRAYLIPLAVLTLPSIGCGDPHAPSPTNLRVLITTVGVDQDGSYAVRADDGPWHFIRASLYLFLSPGVHDVVLGEVAPNCSAESPDSVSVTIPLRGEDATVAFEVACRATTGAIEVAAPTIGRDFDPNGYTVHLDDALVTRVYSGGTAVVEGLSPGHHAVRLDDFSANCGLNGPSVQDALVTAGGLSRDTVRATFDGSCEAVTGDVQLLTTTTGADRDANGYTLTFDGEVVIAPCGFYDYYCEPGAPLMLVPSGSYLLLQVSAGDHSYALGDIAPNCTALAGPSRTVSVAPGETSVVRFDLSCDES
jgi:hypothetical protein